MPRGSGKLAGAVSRLEHDRFWPGAIAQALQQWSRTAHRPSLGLSGGCGCTFCSLYYLTDERGVLEAAMHALAPEAARELRRLVKPLDDLYIAKTWPDPFAPPDAGWSVGRCWG